MKTSLKSVASSSNLSAFSNVMLQTREYESLREKYKSISSRNVSKHHSIDSQSNLPWLKTLEGQVKVYEKECQALSNRLCQPKVSEIDLERNIKLLKNRILVLEKDNFRLGSNNKHLPKIQIHTVSKIDLEENIRTLKILKESISELEAKQQENLKTSNYHVERFQKLAEKQKRLNTELGDYIPVQPDNRYAYLKRKLEALTTSWKTNVSKYEIRISELEEELAGFKEKLMHMNAQNFKKSQQIRLLKMSHQEVVMQKDAGKLSGKPDIDHPDAGFMYKPSVKRLYNI